MTADDTNSPAIDIRQRIRWYAYIRFFFLMALGIPGVLPIYLYQGFSDEFIRDFLILCAALFSNVVLLILLKLRDEVRYQKILAASFIGVDIFLATAIIFANGGVESRNPILYAIPILMSAAIFGRIATYIAAVVCAQMYLVVVVGIYFGFLPTIGAINPDLGQSLPYVINTIFYIPAILIVIALAVDIITRLLIEKQRQAQENLQALIRAQEIAKLGSWEWDLTSDQVIWSDTLIQIWGMRGQPENFNYDTYLTMIHPEDSANLNRAIANALKHKKPYKVDHRIIMQNGTIKYIHGEGRPTLDRRGRIVKIVGTAQDVTELHDLDDAKREFVSLASHQLRTPASGVKAFLSLLLDGYAGDITKKQREFLLKAYTSNNRQLDIIDNLLSLAALESGKLKLHKEPVDATRFVRRCLKDHRPEIRAHKHKLVTDFSRKPMVVNIDTTHLQMAIDNLLSNAIKYTPDNGTLKVATMATGSSLYIDVEDSGIGIAADKLPSLFQKFSRLRDPASRTIGGSGLGLYLAKQIVMMHKGTITVRSRPGRGTRFRIRLPIYRK